jgi:riboflavin synthase
MFTGIVEEVGRVRARTESGLTIAASGALEGSRLGDSIAVNGVCLTITTLGQETFTVDIMPETNRRTNLGLLRVGDRVNLERALAVGDRMGGHFVQGHVDGTGKVLEFRPEGEAVIASFSAPPEAMRYIVPKGFIAVDGMSLTVIECDAERFTVSLVKFTRERTILQEKAPGYVVNLEVDILGKYVERFVQGGGRRGITEDFLAQHGYL